MLDRKSLITGLTIEKCSMQENKSRWRQKVVDDMVVDDWIYCIMQGLRDKN